MISSLTVICTLYNRLVASYLTVLILWTILVTLSRVYHIRKCDFIELLCFFVRFLVEFVGSNLSRYMVVNFICDVCITGNK